MRNAACLCLGLSLLLGLSAPLLSAKENKKKKNDLGGQSLNLVWPPPPLRPRIRYVSFIRSSEDVTGKVKLSFAERLMGRSPSRSRMRLRKPYGVAVGADERIFVADSAQRVILVFDLKRGSVKIWKGTSQFPLSLPVGLAFDASGRLFVTDSFAHRVVIFNARGKPVLAFAHKELKRPGGIAINPALGRVYVVDVAASDIKVFDLSSLRLTQVVGGKSTPGDPEPGSFQGPTNIALDRQGRLFVTDTFNRRVQVLDSEGKFLYLFGTLGVQPGDFVRPKGIAIDSENHVYIVDAEFNNLQVLDEKGQPLMFLGSIGTAPGQFLLPTGLAIDGRDRIYVTEHGIAGGRLQIFQYLSESSKAPTPGPKSREDSEGR